MAKQPVKKKAPAAKKKDAITDEDLARLNLSLSDEMFLQNLDAMEELQIKEEEMAYEHLKPRATPRPITKENLQQQRVEAMKELAELQKKQVGQNGEIKYYNIKPDRKTAMASYNRQFNTLVVGDLSQFKDEPMKFDRVLQHEQHHRLFAQSKIKTADGKEVLSREAPMSMSQHYKLEQADEIGSKITELMTMRQKYVEAASAKTTLAQRAKLSLSANHTNPDTDKLLNALDKSYQITKNEGNKYKFKDGDKEVIVDLGNKQCSVLDEYIKSQSQFNALDQEMRNEWVKDDDTGWYWRQVKNGTIKPLSTDPHEMKSEMDKIGSGMASNWQAQYGQNYDAQCTNQTETFFNQHNFQEIKQNDDNYNKALKQALTIGGWDFSEQVKSQLSAPEKIQKIDKQIAAGENEAAIIQKAEKSGMRLRKNWNEDYDSLEFRIAAELAGNGKISGTFETPKENLSTAEIAQYEAAYNKVKRPEDKAFNPLLIPQIQAYVAEIKSGKESGKTAEQFSQRTDYKKEYQGAPLVTNNRQKDFSKPFLKEYYQALQKREVQKAKERVDNVVKGQQQLAKQEQKPQNAQPQISTQAKTNAVFAAKQQKTI